MDKTAFVTGGTGFIGINLVGLLVNEGWKVTALHRPTSDLTYLKRFPVDLAEGSITNRASLERAIPKGVEVVFHVAGDTSFWSRKSAHQNAINIDGTRNMVDAAASRGVETFIHTSSESAWGRIEGRVTEETPQRGKDSWINYERSKHLGELEALRGVGLGMKVVVLNPTNVVGPYDANNWGRIFLLLRDGALPAVAPGMLSFTHVQDVVRAHLAAVSKGRNGERYILGGDYHSVADFVAEVGRISGTKAPMKAPALLLRIYGRLSVMVAAITGKEPDVTPEIVAMTADTNIRLVSEKAMRELGYRIQPMAVAVKDNYDWLVKEGLWTEPR